MRITTWNVNGMRAIIKKDFMDSVNLFQPDVVCLQEIKARPEQLDQETLSSIQNHFSHFTWNPAQRPGYSGTATWAKNEPFEVKLGLGVEEFDGEGRVIASKFQDFWLFNIYFPNGQRDLGRVPYKLNFYKRLLDICDELHALGQNVILTGDFNTAHREIDLRYPRANSTATGFLPEERVWIDYYLAHGFVDAFRNLYPNKVEYTWWTYISNARKNNSGWRLDYFLVSTALMDQVSDVINHTEVMGSDHCPVSLIINPKQ